MKKFVKSILLLPLLVAGVSCYDTDGSKDTTPTNPTPSTPTVNVTGVSLNATSKTLDVNETFTLVPTIAPNNATNKGVTWTSSNTSVATVSNSGVVTAVAVGKATITVTTNDGKYTSTCNVNVYGLELRIRQDEGEEVYETFDVTTYSDQNFEYKVHHKNGTIDDDWTLIDFSSNVKDISFNDDESKISFTFKVDETESDETVVEYVGNLTLNNEVKVKKISDIDIASGIPTKTVVNEETGEEEVVNDTDPYYICGIVIGYSYYNYTGTLPDTSSGSNVELLVRDLETNDVVGLQHTDLSTKLGDYEKGDKVVIRCTHRDINNSTRPTVGALLLTSRTAWILKTSSGNDYSLDLTQATVLETASEVAETFATRQKRREAQFKLFTLPAGNKYGSGYNTSSGVGIGTLFFGFGYTSDSKEGYTDYAYSNTSNTYPKIKVTVNENAESPTQSDFGMYFTQFAARYSLGSNDGLVKLLYPERYAEDYEGDIYIIQSGTETSPTALNNDKDSISSDHSLTFMYMGGNTLALNTVAVLESSWVK